MKIYKTDSGGEMEEDDFITYIKWMVENFIRNGMSKEHAIKKIFEEDFFGDAIIDKEYFQIIGQRFLKYIQ